MDASLRDTPALIGPAHREASRSISRALPNDREPVGGALFELYIPMMRRLIKSRRTGKIAMSRRLLNIRYRQRRLLWYTLCYERGFLHKLMQSQIVAAENAQSLIRQLQEMWLFGQLDTLGDSKVQQQNDEHAKSIAGLLKQLADLQKLPATDGKAESTSQPGMRDRD
ncbi:hypothetical protein LTR17_001771 [Elasticomyces elasticus]|nr:hypothetical protein LTR17_001771 [Elasticomyces elasticus]